MEEKTLAESTLEKSMLTLTEAGASNEGGQKHERKLIMRFMKVSIFAIIFLMAAAYTLKSDQHVRVDVLYTRFSPKVQAWVNIAGSLIFLIPFCLLVMWTSWNFVRSSFMMREGSPNPGGLPARYLLKGVIPISFLLLLLQGVSTTFKAILTITEHEHTKERTV